MNFFGIDLHKKTISICVVNQEREKEYTVDSSRYDCRCSGPFLMCLIRCLYGVGSIATHC
jgi:hypothetical protein